MVLGYSEFEGFDRRKNNIMGPIEHFDTGAAEGGAAEGGAAEGAETATATATEGGAETATATATEGGAATATATNPVADQVTATGESTFNTILSDYTDKKNNFNVAVSIYNPEQENNISDIIEKATEIIDHIKLIRTETDRISGSTQTAFNKIDGIIKDVVTTEKNEDILNKRTTFDKKYNNIKELNNKNKKIVTILLVVNIVIMTILLFGSYLVLSDKGNPFGKSKVSNNKNGYNNLSSL